jgi:hypothetical protein
LIAAEKWENAARIYWFLIAGQDILFAGDVADSFFMQGARPWLSR